MKKVICIMLLVSLVVIPSVAFSVEFDDISNALITARSNTPIENLTKRDVYIILETLSGRSLCENGTEISDEELSLINAYRTLSKNNNAVDPADELGVGFNELVSKLVQVAEEECTCDCPTFPPTYGGADLVLVRNFCYCTVEGHECGGQCKAIYRNSTGGAGFAYFAPCED